MRIAWWADTVGHGGLTRWGTVGRRAVSLNPAQPAHLGHASPSYYSIGSCRPDPTFWHARPWAKMGYPAQWTPLRLAMIPSQEHHHKLFKPWKSPNAKRHTEALYIPFFVPNWWMWMSSFFNELFSKALLVSPQLTWPTWFHHVSYNLQAKQSRSPNPASLAFCP